MCAIIIQFTKELGKCRQTVKSNSKQSLKLYITFTVVLLMMSLRLCCKAYESNVKTSCDVEVLGKLLHILYK